MSLQVTLYTLEDCPFCPLVEEQLRSLQEELEFDLEKVNLSRQPTAAARHGIRAVPWVEVGPEKLVGPVEREQLADAILRAMADRFAATA